MLKKQNQDSLFHVYELYESYNKVKEYRKEKIPSNSIQHSVHDKNKEIIV